MMNSVSISYVASVVSAQPDLPELFIQSVGGGKGGSAKATLKGTGGCLTWNRSARRT